MSEDQLEELVMSGMVVRVVLFRGSAGWGCWSYHESGERGHGRLLHTGAGQLRIWPRLSAVLRFLEAIGAVGRCSIAIEIDPYQHRAMADPDNGDTRTDAIGL